MAQKTINIPTTPSQKKPKAKTSIFLCCFGSPLPTKGSDNSIPKIPKMKKKKKSSSWFFWPRIRFNKNSTAKTVPLEASLPDHHKPYSKSKSKSTLKSLPPVTNPPPSSQPPPVLPGTPYYTPSQSRHGASNVEDTRQQGRASPSHSKRQARRVSSTLSMQTQTTSKKVKNAGGSYDAVVGMSVVAVTLIIMIFWGRLCAVLFTSAWLYFIPRFRQSAIVNDNDEEDHKTTSKKVDLDSEVYKKKVIMEGLLERSHRGSAH